MNWKRNPLHPQKNLNKISESETSTEDEEESNTLQTLQVHHAVNETTHDEENSSEAEDDTSEGETVAEMQTCENNGEQNNIQEQKLLTTNFEVQVENRKIEGLITHSTDQQIFKFKVNSATDQEVWGVYIDFQSIHSKWTIDAILQHMGFYVTTENPSVMMRENHNTQRLNI